MVYNIIITILILLVHKISFPQKKYMNKFATSAIPKRCQIVATMHFSTRSCGHVNDTRTQEFEANAPD